DRAGAPEVAIVNEALASQYFSGVDSIGQRISIGYLGGRYVREIVGIAGNIKQEELGAPTRPEIYVPYLQMPWLGTQIVVRPETRDPVALRKDIQAAIWRVDKAQPVSRAVTVDQLLADLVAEPRLYTLLLGVFAAVALILASVGIYGVISYSVTERTREIGIRMALGAEQRMVLGMVVRQSLRLILLGVAIGLAAAFALTRLLTALLFGVGVTDPVTFGG